MLSWSEGKHVKRATGICVINKDNILTVTSSMRQPTLYACSESI